MSDIDRVILLSKRLADTWNELQEIFKSQGSPALQEQKKQRFNGDNHRQISHAQRDANRTSKEELIAFFEKYADRGFSTRDLLRKFPNVTKNTLLGQLRYLKKTELIVSPKKDTWRLKPPVIIVEDRTKKIRTTIDEEREAKILGVVSKGPCTVNSVRRAAKMGFYQIADVLDKLVKEKRIKSYETKSPDSNRTATVYALPSQSVG